MAIEPVTREERFLAAAGGRNVTPPTPITRKEQLLQGIIDAVKSGGATPDVIENAVNKYLEANPVKPGATTEQVAQIEQNKSDIADLQAEIDDKQQKGDYVKTVNGNKPDASGNVMVATGGNGSGENVNGLTQAQSDALNGLLLVIAFTKADVSAEVSAFREAFGLGGDSTEKTLTSISATYSGGSVPVGTAVTALTGVVVTAHYSDGSSAAVTGYTLSGSIAEGSNTITVSYGGMTTTFTVTGVAESGGDLPETVAGYTFYDYIVNPTTTKDYVNTGITYGDGFSTISTECDVKVTASKTKYVPLLGCRNVSGGTASKANFGLFIGSANTVEAQVLGVDIYSTNEVTPGVISKIKYTFNDGSVSTITVDGISTDITTVTAEEINGHSRTLYLYGYNRNGALDAGSEANACELGEIIMTDNGTKVYDFVPAYEEATSKYGFYERINGVFHPCVNGMLTCGNWGA